MSVWYHKLGHDRFFHIITNSSFIYYAFISRYVAGVANQTSFRSRTLGGNGRKSHVLNAKIN
jgi:hypothetical protein